MKPAQPLKFSTIFLLLTLIACQENEADFPELTTEFAQQIGATSVVMGAEIKQIGPVRPVHYGFLWDIQPNLSVIGATNEIVLGEASEPRKFSIKVDNLSPSTLYYYRGFAATVIIPRSITQTLYRLPRYLSFEPCNLRYLIFGFPVL